MVSADGSSQSFGGLTAQIGWFGLRVGGHPALSLHSSNEPGELSQWICHDDSTINIVLVIIIIIIIVSLSDVVSTAIQASEPSCYETNALAANIRINFTSPETRTIVLHDVEDHMIVCSFFWTKHWNVTNGETDRHGLASTAAVCIVRTHCKNAKF